MSQKIRCYFRKSRSEALHGFFFLGGGGKRERAFISRVPNFEENMEAKTIMGNKERYFLIFGEQYNSHEEP